LSLVLLSSRCSSGSALILLLRSKASPLATCSTRRTNLYPVGFYPFQNPSCNCEGVGAPRWDGTILNRGMFQPCEAPVTHPTLDLVKLFLSVLTFVTGVHAPLRIAPLGTTPVSR